MARAVKDIDRGWGRIIAALAEIKGKEIATGLQAGDKTKDGKMDIARLAAIHEFGTEIDVAARTQTIYHKIGKSGGFLRGGRFVKARRSNFARDVSVAAHKISIPERSFVRSTCDEKQRSWQDKARMEFGRVIDGKQSAGGMLDRIGNVMEGDIKRKIVAGPFAPNAPSTIRRKRSTRPLIDSGRMRQSVRYVVRPRGSGRFK